MKQLLLAFALVFVVLSTAEAGGFKRPRLPGPDGSLTQIWARSSAEGYLNAKRFCRTMNDPPPSAPQIAGRPELSWGYTCVDEGDDELSFLDWRKGKWELQAAEPKTGPSLCERTGYCPVDQHGWPLGTAASVKCDLHGRGYPVLDWVYCGNSK